MSVIKQILKVLSASRKMHLHNYIDIDHNCHENILVTESGALLSVFKVQGLLVYPSVPDWKMSADSILNGLKSVFKSEGHTVQWVYEKDKSKTKNSLLSSTARALRTMSVNNIDCLDIYQENIDVNEELICYEESYIAIWTDNRLIEKTLYKARVMENGKHAAPLSLYLSETPNVFAVIKEMVDKHLSVIEDFQHTMRNAKIGLELLDCDTACNKIGRSIDASLPKNWKARLIGMKRYLKTSHKGNVNEDGSDLFWTKLNEQLGNKIIDYPKRGVVNIGGQNYKSGFIKDFPISIKPFRSLIESIDQDVPLRISFKIASGKGFDWSFRQALNGFVAFGHSDNRQMMQEMELLEQNHLHNPNLRLSVSFSTWSDQIEKLDYNFSRLDQAIQSWGICNTVLDQSDELEMMIDGVIGATPDTPAIQTYCPLSDIVKLLPFDRTASLWKSGFVVFRTSQNTSFPWTPISPITNPSIELYIARSRMGKSVLSNAVASALLFDGGQGGIPYLATIDVGDSSVGVYNLIRDRLPDNQKHLVVTYKINMDGDDYINPFERSPCVDNLFDYQYSFVSGLLTLLAQDSTGSMHKNMVGFIEALIREVYLAKAGSSANKYTPGILLDVDDWIDSSGFELFNDTAWHEVEKALGRANEWKMAGDCAVYASPLLEDFITTANESLSLGRLYNSDGTDSVIKEFILRMTEAMKKFKILTRFSTVNFKQARLRSIDLQNAIIKDEILGPRQNGVMYTLALYLGSGDFMLNKGCLNQVPKEFLQYYEDEVIRLRSVPRRLFMDEFHQASGLRQTVTNVERYSREGGKWGINVALASQKHEDFSQTLIDQATSYFFLGGVSKEVAKIYKEKFSLSDTDATALSDNTIHGPKKGGSSLLYVYKTPDGQFSQVLRFAVGKQLLWANSTNSDDLLIKEILTKAVGSKAMLKILSTEFPESTIQKEVEKRKNALSDESGEKLGRSPVSYAVLIANELLEKYSQKNAA
ncbi:hypothetical protein OCF84_20775 (plasmid) [Shewanella xiamenensis]|uniref:Uncharacterized protein n=1 Tax=Shewanella xiamenensis TaxID=332186 RepID=A0ABT6UFQ3_9GAMM|nr:hypothetical protein [Shewanella xiamenensis]MDI5833297.1 hypothetical protein [Shewanella xiamenensis]WHF57953.1 hypothetical protein OCF84_20775 [Shewanella xiamenensis]